MTADIAILEASSARADATSARRDARNPPRRAGPKRSARRAVRRIRGLSMVELLVGVAIGLLVAAGGAGFLASHLRESRSVLIESRLMQDLRTAADVITRDLRRAGYWSGAEAGVWAPAASAVLANPYVAVEPSASASDSVGFRYSRDSTENQSVDTNEQFGYRLRNGTLEMQLGAGNWQALTDSGTVAITVFSVTPSTQEISLAAACPSACAASSTTCPPRARVRSLALLISGRAVGDGNVTRTVRSNVRLRNDAVSGACQA